MGARLLDEDHDGKITMNELKKILGKLKQPKEEWPTVDGCESISHHEMKRWNCLRVFTKKHHSTVLR